jgi:hypothetical protein
MAQSCGREWTGSETKISFVGLERRIFRVLQWLFCGCWLLWVLASVGVGFCGCWLLWVLASVGVRKWHLVARGIFGILNKVAGTIGLFVCVGS